MNTVGTVDALRRNNVQVTGREGGPIMMFAHGFGCNQLAWHAVARQFEEDHTVVLFDHVGAGGSDASAYEPSKYDALDGYADDVLEILDALDASEVTFIGHSVSAMIGILAANREPSRFARLVLVGPSPRYTDDAEYRGGFQPADIDAMLDGLDANYIGWSRQTAPVIMGAPDRPDLGERLADSFCSVDPVIARHFARVTFTADNRDDLVAVRTPTLVLQCRADAIAPVEVGRFVHEAIAGSTFRLLQATGHVPNLSAPDEVASEIRSFLA